MAMRRSARGRGVKGGSEPARSHRLLNLQLLRISPSHGMAGGADSPLGPETHLHGSVQVAGYFDGQDFFNIGQKSFEIVEAVPTADAQIGHFRRGRDATPVVAGETREGFVQGRALEDNLPLSPGEGVAEFGGRQDAHLNSVGPAGKRIPAGE